MPPNEKTPAAIHAHAIALPFDGAARAVQRAVPVEAPVGVIYAPTPYAVMMASPCDLEDFAWGFSLTEGVISRAEDIRSVSVDEDPRGIRLTITLASDRLRTHLARARNLAGRTGCGVCGVEDIEHLPLARSKVREGAPLKLSAVRRAIFALDDRLPVGALTRATHAAAWCDDNGGVGLVREDVGRHNALDKLIGALLRANVDPATGFVVVTSRCSFEMVEKTAAFGARAIVAVSAPTSLAIDRAQALGVALVAIARRDGAMLFTNSAGLDNDLAPEGVCAA